jgi:hypothetical protein
MAELILYSQKKNPQCEILRGVLKEEGIAFSESDIRKPESIRELIHAGCHALEPPVIKLIDGSTIMGFFTNDDLFWDGEIVREVIMDLSQQAIFSVRKGIS